MKIPTNYLPVMPYLIVNNAKGFLSFAKEVFEATEQLIVPSESGQIMHGEIRIGDAVIMFAQATEDWKSKSAGMFLYVENLDKVYQAAVDHEVTVLMPPETKDYGYTAGFEDHFGNQWWIAQGE